MTVVTILEEAKKLISDPEKWTTECGARDQDGWQCSATSLDALCWCAVGSVHKITAGENLDYILDIMDRTCGPSPDDDARPLAYFNDTHTHSEVLAKFDEAIALARREAL